MDINGSQVRYTLQEQDGIATRSETNTSGTSVVAGYLGGFSVNSPCTLLLLPRVSPLISLVSLLRNVVPFSHARAFRMLCAPAAVQPTGRFKWEGICERLVTTCQGSPSLRTSQLSYGGKRSPSIHLSCAAAEFPGVTGFRFTFGNLLLAAITTVCLVPVWLLPEVGIFVPV